MGAVVGVCVGGTVGLATFVGLAVGGRVGSGVGVTRARMVILTLSCIQVPPELYWVVT